jgi:hypothetical protein
VAFDFDVDDLFEKPGWISAAAKISSARNSTNL